MRLGVLWADSVLRVKGMECGLDFTLICPPCALWSALSVQLYLVAEQPDPILQQGQE
jgi:hypothetical protein